MLSTHSAKDSLERMVVGDFRQFGRISYSYRTVKNSYQTIIHKLFVALPSIHMTILKKLKINLSL
jgi:hypothetical protein